MLARVLRQTISARQANGHPWQNNSARPTMAHERACFRAIKKGKECCTR